METLGKLDGLHGGMYLGGELQMLVNRVIFDCRDGKEGRLYIVTHIEHIVPQVKSMLIIFFVSLAAILVAASGCISVWVYRGLVAPIKKLQDATHNIAEGNLDFNLKSNRHDEIGELIDDFEVMRRKLKESAEEKIQNDKESRELISNISHDLKTPMTAIKGYVEGIMDGIADTPEKMDRYVRTIYNKTMDMDKLINELTLYSKIDANKITYNFNKINVAEYFDDCVSELKVELESRNIELGYFNYADKAAVIIADPEQLKRVINNIISNSVKYMSTDRKGIINIRVSDADDFVQFEIEDNGKGIAQKDVQYIFDRFYRTDSSRNSAQGGSGIGLSIVKKIISDHGGQIWATSKEGTGTVMHFVLSKILIIEDEESIAELERDYLEISSYEVTICNDGEKGLKEALDNEYDLYILDLMLPGVDGFEICKAIRNKKNTPIIMVSAKKDDIDKIRGLGLGADDYMTKPFSPSELVARVKAHLARYERLVGSAMPENDVIEIRGLKIDKTARRVFVNGEEKTFTTKEFDLLTFLAQNPNHVYSKEELFNKIWDMESIGDIATVTVHIKKIREKIEFDTSNPQYIETIWGVGYRFKA